ncbi:MAG: shikimate kinase [Alicyclobacillus sp.]|nr:shikimate kinase [Alicyclobacillus sp.]
MFDRTIVFIGFMGVGKTTIGQTVAKKLGRRFVDVDDEIERAAGMSIRDIFERYGEAHFRQLEEDMTIQFCLQKRNVVSLGGGAFNNPRIRDVCMRHCVIVYLDISWDSWEKGRLPLIQSSRPLLRNSDRETIAQLFEQRKRTTYNLYHCKFRLDQLDPDAAAEYVIDVISDHLEPRTPSKV